MTVDSRLELNNLNNKERIDLYRQANITHNFGLVKQLNELGMKPKVPSFSGPAIISTSMDIDTKYNIILGFLKDLRENNRLFTEKEFNNLTEKKWFQKDNKLSRILGTDFLDQKIKELQLKRFKVPFKIAVVKESEVLKISGKQHESRFYDFKSDQIKVYAQEIKSVKRKLTRDEIDEFVKIIVAADFCDLNLSNFIITEDGVYFIDTEFKSFDEPIRWNKMKRFECLMNEEDIEYFREQIKDKKDKDQWNERWRDLVQDLKSYKIYEPENTTAIEELENKISSLTYVGSDAVGVGYNPNTFDFDLKDILNK